MSIKLPVERQVKATEIATGNVVYDQVFVLYGTTAPITNLRFRTAAWTVISRVIGVEKHWWVMNNYKIEFLTVEKIPIQSQPEHCNGS